MLLVPSSQFPVLRSEHTFLAEIWVRALLSQNGGNSSKIEQAWVHQLIRISLVFIPITPPISAPRLWVKHALSPQRPRKTMEVQIAQLVPPHMLVSWCSGKHPKNPGSIPADGTFIYAFVLVIFFCTFFLLQQLGLAAGQPLLNTFECMHPCTTLCFLI